LTICTNQRTILLVLLLVLGVILLYLGYSQNGSSLISDHQSAGQKAAVVGENSGNTENTLPFGEVLVTPQSKPNAALGEGFVVSYRFERERNRSKQVEMLQDLINNANVSSAVKQEAEKKILGITSQMEQEMKLENLLLAKGYPEAVAAVQAEAVTIIVKNSLLGNADVANIADLVSRTTGHHLEQISIIPHN
jgi:stage III sporulation protein AH